MWVSKCVVIGDTPKGRPVEMNSSPALKSYGRWWHSVKKSKPSQWLVVQMWSYEASLSQVPPTLRLVVLPVTGCSGEIEDVSMLRAKLCLPKVCLKAGGSAK